jgi:hypothetical protein
MSHHPCTKTWEFILTTELTASYYTDNVKFKEKHTCCESVKFLFQVHDFILMSADQGALFVS